MKVHSIIRTIQDWVKEHTALSPGYLGAHLVGSLAYMPLDAMFHQSRDLQICLVFEEHAVPAASRIQSHHKNIVFECRSRSHHEYILEIALSNPELAPNLVANSVIDDPTGFLKSLQRQVRSE